MRLRPSPTLALATQIAQARGRGDDALSLSTPTFTAPGALPDMDASWTRLSPPKGLTELRAAAQEALFGRWSLPDHEIMVTAGAKAGLFAILRAALDPGANVLVPQPCWPSYFDLCAVANLNAVGFPTQAADGFALDIAQMTRICEARDIRAVMLSNPCNPTGRILGSRELEDLACLCKAREMLLILDQSFSSIIFDEAAWARSVVSGFDQLVVVDSFSKNYLLQGARVAAALLPGWLVERAVSAHQTIASSAPTPGQKLALHAIETGSDMPRLDVQRRLAADFIQAQGWACHEQGGTFYFFPEVPDMGQFQRHAEARNVFLLTGDAFGAGYERHFRFCFCKPEAELVSILQRLGEYGPGHDRV